MDALNLASDLQFMFEREGVDLEVATKLADNGFRTLAKFATLAEDQKDLRETLKADFGLDGAVGGLAVKGRISSVMVAWSNAKNRVESQAKLESEHAVRNEPKPLPGDVYRSMKDSFKTRFRELQDDRTPSRHYLEKKLETVEKNDLKAELLSEVLSVPEDNDDGALQTVLDRHGTFRAVKLGSSCPLPDNPEQLRRRLGIWGAAWIFVAGVHTTRPFLKDLEPQDFTDYVEYLLGKDVMKHIAEVDGVAPTGQYWELILKYDHSLRKEMMELVMTGTPLKTALKQATESAIVKERNFTTPLARLESKLRAPARGPHPPAALGDYPPSKRARKLLEAKGKGGGKGKGKGRGKGKAGGKGCARETPQGKPICFAFNNVNEGCTRQGCTFAHVCGVCFLPNVPMHKCDHSPKVAPK